MAQHMAASRVVAGDADQTYARVLPMPLEDLFVSWHGPMPPIRGTEGPTPWGTAGQRRTVVLVGPGSMTETLTELDPPHHFSYHIDGVRGPMSPLVASVEGRWSFASVAAGTKVTWAWTVTGRAPLHRLLPAFAWLWRGYADRVLRRLDDVLRTADAD